MVLSDRYSGDMVHSQYAMHQSSSSPQRSAKMDTKVIGQPTKVSVLNINNIDSQFVSK